VPAASAGNRKTRQENTSQPDPLKTSQGYIGAESFSRQRQAKTPSGRSGGPRKGGSGGGRPR
jgi:23S rRNA pseudouridine2605 synthase